MIDDETAQEIKSDQVRHEPGLPEHPKELEHEKRQMANFIPVVVGVVAIVFVIVVIIAVR